MSSPVPQAPSGFALRAVQTGKPVGSAGLARLADEIGFLNGYNLHKCGEATIPLRPAGRSQLEGLAHNVHVPWSRSPGAQLVRVAVEIHPSVEVDNYQSITTSLPSGATWLDAAGLDGTGTFYNPPTGRTSPREIVGWADVSGCTAGALTDVFTFACTPSTKGAGIKRVALVEAPLAGLAIDATEPGWDAAATRAGRLVIDGGASSPRGMQRLFRCLREARAGARQHFLLSGLESADTTAYGTTPHWSRLTASFGAIDWLASAGATAPTWYLAPRILLASSIASTWTERVRYRTSNGTSCAVRYTTEPGDIVAGAWVSAGASATTTHTLAGTSGAWAWDSQAFSMPSDGPLVKLSIEAKGPGVGQLLSLACLALIGNDP